MLYFKEKIKSIDIDSWIIVGFLTLYLSGILSYRGDSLYKYLAFKKILFNPITTLGIFLKIIPYVLAPIISLSITERVDESLEKITGRFRRLIQIIILLFFLFTLCTIITKW